MQKIKQFFSKLAMSLREHWHLLFRSAAHNHLRIQSEIAKKGENYQLTIQFGSYSELKKYQKKLRTMTVSLSGAVAMVIVAAIVSPYILNPSRSSAASFEWAQNNWSGAAGSTAATKSAWTGYFLKDNNVTAEAGGVSLTLPTPSDVTETSDADFSGTQTGDGFYNDGSGKLLLKKPTGATCAIGTECASTVCTATLCT